MSQNESAASGILKANPTEDKPARPSMPGEYTVVGSLSVEQTQLVQERQRGRALVMGIILGGLAVLFFALTIVKVGIIK